MFRGREYLRTCGNWVGAGLPGGHWHVGWAGKQKAKRSLSKEHISWGKLLPAAAEYSLFFVCKRVHTSLFTLPGYSDRLLVLMSDNHPAHSTNTQNFTILYGTTTDGLATADTSYFQPLLKSS